MKRNCLLIVLILISVTLFQGCARKQKLDNETLYFNLDTEPPTLDPSKAADTTSGLVIENLFDGLVDYDVTKPDIPIIPKVAKSWKVSPDGRVYTYYLRDDVYWTDGKKVTAHDFEYSWRRILDPATASEYAYFLFDVKNAQSFNQQKVKDFSKVGIKAVDDYTFRVTLSKPVAYFEKIAAFQDLAPLRKDVIEKWGDTWTEPQHIVTNGPFILKEWRHDYQLILERNETYFGEKAKLKRAHCFMVNEYSTALSLYQTRKIDIIRSLPPLEIPKNKTSPEFHAGHFLALYYVGFQTKKPPMDNIYVRQAMAHAIDRKEITDVLEKGDIPTTSLLPKGILGHNENIGFKFNAAKAQELMEKAGYEKKKEGDSFFWIDKKKRTPFPPLTLTYNTNEAHKTVFENLQAQWKRNLGINTSISNQEWKVYIKTMVAAHKDPKNAPFHIFRMGWNADYPDPDNFTTIFTSYSDNNHTSWGNPKYDQLTEKARSIFEKEKREKIYDEIQKILVEEDAVIIPIYNMAFNVMWRNEVKGIHLNPLDSWHLDLIWLERK